jgi:hypothetical protein
MKFAPGCAAGGGLDNDGPAGAGASSDFPAGSFLRRPSVAS